MSDDYIAGGPIDLQIVAAMGEGIEISLPDRRFGCTIPNSFNKSLDRQFFTLDKSEKFLLLSELQNNIGVHQNLTGHWFLSPVADHVLKQQIAKDPVKKELYGMVLDLLAEITKDGRVGPRRWKFMRWMKKK